VIRVLLADDQALVRAGFRFIAGSAPDIEVVGEAADGAAAVDLARSLRAEVVLMDIRMPGIDGLEATRQIAADPELSGVRVIILTTFEADEYVFEAIRAGASGFLVKDTEPEDLISAIRVVARGDALLSPSVTRRLISSIAGRGPAQSVNASVLSVLTDRERGGARPGRRGHDQRRDRDGPVHEPADRQDPRQPDDDQTRRAGPGPAGRDRLRDRPGPAGPVLKFPSRLAVDRTTPAPVTTSARS
jgi:DNA-binding NarL/FixJ family response regulator